MKKILLITLLTMAFTACGDISDEQKTQNAVAKGAILSSSSQTASTPSGELQSEFISDCADPYSNLPATFGTYEEMEDSEEMKFLLMTINEDNGWDFEKFSEPEIDSEKMKILNGVKLYYDCIYFDVQDIETRKILTVCLEFMKVDDYASLEKYMQELENGSGYSYTEYSKSDPENEYYAVRGTHFSIFRVSNDGFIYSITCESIPDEELYEYLDKIKM